MKNDILSDVLHTVKLSGAVFFDVSASSPWVAEAPPMSSIAPRIMPEAQHVMEYHVITSGFCWATLLDSAEAPVRLTPGSVIMFPQGDQHVLSSEPNMRTSPNMSIFERATVEAPPFYLRQLGDGPDDTRMTCGFIGCDTLPFNPIIQTLPRMIHIPDGYNRADGWLRELINTIMKETRRRRVGMQSVLAKLSELLFIEVVRCHAESLPAEARGWLAALADARIGRAIKALHRDPKRSWTLDILAREVGVSRTVLVNCFSEHLGMAPMTYLSKWRMQLAARMLADGNATIAQIAEEVGYESEAAFSRSFKRSTGVSPGAWRSERAAAAFAAKLSETRT